MVNITLFCIPHAGAINLYFILKYKLQNDIALKPLELPGHGERLRLFVKEDCYNFLRLGNLMLLNLFFCLKKHKVLKLVKYGSYISIVSVKTLFLSVR